jgi:hypothetical protein
MKAPRYTGNHQSASELSEAATVVGVGPMEALVYCSGCLQFVDDFEHAVPLTRFFNDRSIMYVVFLD